jgi:hypothetical protein
MKVFKFNTAYEVQSAETRLLVLHRIKSESGLNQIQSKGDIQCKFGDYFGSHK